MTKQRIWLTATLAAVLGIGSLALVGCGGGETTEETPAADASGGGSPSGGMMSGGGPPGGAPMMPAGGSMAMMSGPPGMGGGGMMGGGAAQSAPAATAGPKVRTAPPGSRVDPFAPWWNSTPPPPPAIGLVPQIRLAAFGTAKKPVEEKVVVQEVPTRRVAGIGNGPGVYALIEGPEGQSVVRPGDSVGDYRVESITASAVVLKRVVGNETYIQTVPLTDVGAQSAAGFMGGPGAPGGPAMGSGGGMRGRRPGGMGMMGMPGMGAMGGKGGGAFGGAGMNSED